MDVILDDTLAVGMVVTLVCAVDFADSAVVAVVSLAAEGVINLLDL